ncbi:MAG TPA: glycosyltransferase family 39 protein [Trichormus sp.]|jgi:uncharacterized membrane protein
MTTAANGLTPQTVQQPDGASAPTPSSKIKTVWTIGFWLVIAIGVFFRFYHIDQREYWCDESYTSITISGHPRSELAELLATKQDLHAGDLKIFQQTQGPRRKCLEDLITKGSQHPPVYYGLARLWSERFGCSVAAMRMLPALLSLLVLPAAYWLCLELFQSARVAQATVALLAISPVQVLYAQNAREYPLWLSLVCVTGALLLRCLQRSSFANWCAYSIATAIALYTFPLQGLVSAGQALFVLLLCGWQRRRLLFAQIGALSAAGVLYSPWLFAIYSHRRVLKESLGWIEQKHTWAWILGRVHSSFDSIFVDFSQVHWQLILAVSTAALLVFIRLSPSRTHQRTFIFCLITASVLPLLLHDFIYCFYSAELRYWLPSVLGIMMIFAFAAVRLLESRSKAACLAGGALLASLLGCSVVSCFQNANLAWHPGFSVCPQLPAQAQTINKSHDPVLIINAIGNPGQVISLCRLLRDDVQLHIVQGDTIDSIPNEHQQVFVFTPWEGPIHVPFGLDCRFSAWDFGVITRRDTSQ